MTQSLLQSGPWRTVHTIYHSVVYSDGHWILQFAGMPAVDKSQQATVQRIMLCSMADDVCTAKMSLLNASCTCYCICKCSNVGMTVVRALKEMCCFIAPSVFNLAGGMPSKFQV